MYIINIPQGASGRLKLDHSACYKIKGLYTSGFSTCNILACVGKNRLALFHFDAFSSVLQFSDDVDWVLESNAPEETDVVVIYREAGEELKDTCQEYLQGLTKKNHQVIQKLLNNEKYDGILLTFNSYSKKINYKNHTVGDDVIHDNICKLINNIEPLGIMVHHPLEEQFVTTRKINQLTGLQKKKQLYDNYLKTGIITAFNDHCIFLSGSMWQNIESQHLVVDIQEPFVKNIMANFSKQDSYVEIARKINFIAEKIQVDLGFDYMHSMAPIAMNIQEYLYDYDYLAIFKHNLKSIAITDSKFKDNLCNLLEKSNNFIEIKKFIADNIFQFILEQPLLIKHFEQNYTERSIYVSLKQQYMAAEQQAKSFIMQGDQQFAGKKYQVAVEKYLDAADAIMVKAMHGNNLVEKIKDRLKLSQGKLEQHNNTAKFFLPLHQSQHEEPQNYLNSTLFKGCEPPPNNHKIENGRTIILSPH